VAPVKNSGKKRSRQNALRHGLTAETVIDALEDAEDYAAFEMAVTADYDAQSAVARELVLRLASLLWRLRRATAIERGLFKVQAKHLLQFRKQRRAHQERQKVVDAMYRDAVATNGDVRQDQDELIKPPAAEPDDKSDDLTRALIRQVPNTLDFSIGPDFDWKLRPLVDRARGRRPHQPGRVGARGGLPRARQRR
jgi:hypothetical protein